MEFFHTISIKSDPKPLTKKQAKAAAAKWKTGLTTAIPAEPDKSPEQTFEAARRAAWPFPTSESTPATNIDWISEGTVTERIKSDVPAVTNTPKQNPNPVRVLQAAIGKSKPVVKAKAVEYEVVLHNNARTPYQLVLDVLEKHFGLMKSVASSVMYAANNAGVRGVAVVPVHLTKDHPLTQDGAKSSAAAATAYAKTRPNQNGGTLRFSHRIKKTT